MPTTLFAFHSHRTSHHHQYRINNHICKQSGWKTMEYLQFQQFGCTINTSCITKDSVNEDNYLEKISCITHLLNCEYTIVMEKFNVMLGVILDKCQEEKYNHQIDQFGHCLNRILDIVKSSITTFSKMLDAAIYINQIDLRIINSSLINPKCIENEIELFYNNAAYIAQEYFDSTITPKKHYIFDFFEQMITFHKKAENIILYLYTNRKVCGPDHKSNIPTDLITVFNINQMNKSVNNSNDYINNIYNEVSSYMAQVIENNFSNLGFEQLIGTNYFKFIHCISDVYNINGGIKLIENLLSHDGWKLWKNVAVKNILSNWNIISIDDLIVPIDKVNYNFIRTSITNIVRCRYIDIFQYFINMLDGINKVCVYENKNSCATSIFDTMVKSDEMFKNMLFALTTLRHTIQSKAKRNTVSRIELQIEFCRNFIYDMRRMYQSSSVFVNQEYYDSTEFLNNIITLPQTVLSIKNAKTNVFYSKYCEIDEKSDLKNLMIEFKNLINVNNITEYTNIHKTMYEFFNVFIEKINKENYENLGFNEITKI
ncbi:uncharacterized protein LOC126894465 isoform X2 [Daktulosphaira vitifoliae]|uniref:uncharacterized protein LOC126894465 isoform X2 n=1 Tax=Daktulosphaira vitifoliae TaxID=58002 RepID=UPI0021A9DFD5|nr:uncharacterized protein LOC126894465 isoform X2 [Daktulosphaira vitifoliae]